MTDWQLNEPESAQQLINILRESGCEFLYGEKLQEWHRRSVCRILAS
jgi:hypothetical protein